MKKHDGKLESDSTEKKTKYLTREQYETKLKQFSEIEQKDLCIRFETVLKRFYNHTDVGNCYLLNYKHINQLKLQFGNKFELATYLIEKSKHETLNKSDAPEIEIFKAVLQRDFEHVEKIIKSNPEDTLLSILAQQIMGRIFLDALECDLYDLAKALIDRGVDVNVPYAFLYGFQSIDKIDQPIKHANTHFLKTEFNEDLTKLLLDNGLNLDLMINYKTAFTHILEIAPETLLLKYVQRVTEVNQYKDLETRGITTTPPFVFESYLMMSLRLSKNKLGFELIKMGADVNYECKDSIGEPTKIWDRAKTVENLTGIRLLLASNKLNLKNYNWPNEPDDLYNTQIKVTYDKLSISWVSDRNAEKTPHISQLFHRMKFFVINDHLLVDHVKAKLGEYADDKDAKSLPLCITAIKQCFSLNWWKSMLICKEFHYDPAETDPVGAPNISSLNIEMLHLIGEQLFDIYYAGMAKEHDDALH